MGKIRHTLELVKFSHSVFALPFALASLLYAAGGWPEPRIFLLVVLAMVTARNTAMAFNRWVDADIDAQNPRTASRHIVTGLLSKKYVLLFVIANALMFVASAYFLNRLCFILSPVVLAWLCFYSLTKRWTPLTHLFLGASLGMAPLGAWIAVRGEFGLFSALLGLAVLFWVAGFDIIYSTQDNAFDRKAGLKSLIVSLGLPASLRLSKFFHLACVGLLAGLGGLYGLGVPYFVTVALVAGFLIYEQSLIRASDLSRVNAAFFTMNGWVGMIFLAGSIVEIAIR